MDRCQFCWDIAEILGEANDTLAEGEYELVHDHAHAQGVRS